MPFSISLQFPTGRYLAARPDRVTPEWPPHPARLFLGLIDALHRGGNVTEEREAMLWLENLSPPDVGVVDPDPPGIGHGAEVYVPQNLPPEGDTRTRSKIRKKREFPALSLPADEPAVIFNWDGDTPAGNELQSLAALVSRLPRFGHSSSLVIATVHEDRGSHDMMTWFRPASLEDWVSGDDNLRVPYRGFLDAAEAAFDTKGRREEEQKLQERFDKKNKPVASPRGRYDARSKSLPFRLDRGEDRGAVTQFDARSLVVLARTGGDHLGLESTWQLTTAMHKALLERWTRIHGDLPIPEWISGHRADGSPSGQNHLSIFPLPAVGHAHARGHIMGLGFALPRPEEIGEDGIAFRLDWRRAMAALFAEGKDLELAPPEGHAWALTLRPLESPAPPIGLRPASWVGSEPHHLWTSVTPVILHRHPKPRIPQRARPGEWDDSKNEAWWRSCFSIMGDICGHQNLPALESADFSGYSPLAGVPPSSRFVAPGARPGRPSRYHLHCSLRFEDPGGGTFDSWGRTLPGLWPVPPDVQPGGTQRLMLPTFEEFFEALHGYPPFPWQSRLAAEARAKGWPDWLILPTGAGKTSVIDIAVYLLACEGGNGRPRSAPVRVVFAVNRRIVVDEAFEHAKRIADKLKDADDGQPHLRSVAESLRGIAGSSGSGDPLEVFPLRGASYTDRSWARTPTQPMVITTTLDQLGSRLLFRGYGVSDRARPIHAALLANDALLILDEAHTCRAFSSTLASIAEYRRSAAEPLDTPFSSIQLTATPPAGVDQAFGLAGDDTENPVLARRLSSPKPAKLAEPVEVPGGKGRVKKFATAIVEEFLAQQAGEGAAPRRTLVVVNRVATAEEVVRLLRQGTAKQKAPEGMEVALLTGRLRPLDRDRLVKSLVDEHSLKAHPEDDVPTLVLVATQCIEVGADFDFDALVTELAPLDSLRQRFGRLNRTGREIQAQATIVAPDDAVIAEPVAKNLLEKVKVEYAKLCSDSTSPVEIGVAVPTVEDANTLVGLLKTGKPSKNKKNPWPGPAGLSVGIAGESQPSNAARKLRIEIAIEPGNCEASGGVLLADLIPAKPDPIYGSALLFTWHWLQAAAVDGLLDFGITAFGDLARRHPSDDGHLAPHAPFPLLLPAHLDLLCQTSPAPHIEPEIGLYIHGQREGIPEVGVLLRDHLRVTGAVAGQGVAFCDPGEACAMISATPPLVTETVSMPLFAVRAWLSDTTEGVDFGDCPGHAESRRSDDGAPPPAILWRRGEASPLSSPGELQPGDLIVLPSETPGIEGLLGSLRGEHDQYEEAHLLARDKVALRLNRASLDKVRDLLSSEGSEEWDQITDTIADTESGSGDPAFDPTSWRAALPCLIQLARTADGDLPRPWIHADAEESWDIRLFFPSGAVAFCRGRAGVTNWPLDPDLAGRQGAGAGASSAGAVTLADHQAGVERRGRANAVDAGLPEPLEDMVALAARYHDIGKLDPRFQAMLLGRPTWFGGDAGALAKSLDNPGRTERRARRERAGVPLGFRHELVSTRALLAAESLRGFAERDLALHLVATHHGLCRPFPPVVRDGAPEPIEPVIEGQPTQVDGVNAPLASLEDGVLERFWMLTRRFGWWGLAYLETILRLADQSESAEPSTRQKR